jgi:hypothetical protein
MTTTLSPEFIAAFADVADPQYCVGNSHALIVCQYSPVSARCACGSTLVLTSDSQSLPARFRSRWVHRDNRGDVSVACPPYDCACGQRHNVPTS